LKVSVLYREPKLLKVA